MFSFVFEFIFPNSFTCYYDISHLAYLRLSRISPIRQDLAQKGPLTGRLVGQDRSDRMHVKSLLVVLMFIVQLVLATQPESEEVSLSEVYNFLTDDLVARRFYVQIVAQVNRDNFGQ